jgi:hypothetical protein
MAANERAAGGTRTLHLLGTSEAPRYLGLGGKRSDKGGRDKALYL